MQTLAGDGDGALVKGKEAVKMQGMDFTETLAEEGYPAPQGSNAREAAACSFREAKVPCAEHQTDVHARIPLVEASQNDVVKLSVPERNLLEVFSVKLLKLDKSELEQMYGCILITTFPTYVVFSRTQGEPLCISREGLLKIRGPDKAIRPMDPVIIVPNLFRYIGCRDQFEDRDERMLWNGIVGGHCDKLLSRQVQSQFGPIEVNFAVYRHGAEARVDVTLSDCQFLSTLVYGSITIQNSMLGEEGRSFLFNNESECIYIDAHHGRDKVAQLPLSRSITVHPIGSVVTVYVKLWQMSIMGTPDQPIADGEIFNFTASVSGREVRTSRGIACKVSVGVTWVEHEMSDSEPIERPYI